MKGLLLECDKPQKQNLEKSMISVIFKAQNHQGGKFASPANKLQKLPFYCTSEH
jgi:hypothetical protein